ncbi:MAG: hypothetical protein KAI99_09060, partial [Cyclobacteriaceae bacterium]|nr:hypothetical protein [Cyclobacteriaceae bacterium]
MKIGILINDLDCLLDWELRVINKIIEHKKLKLELIIRDGRKVDRNQSKLNLGRILFEIQVFIEKKLLKNYIVSNKEKKINTSTKIKTIYVHPQRRGVIDILTDEDANNIKKQKLDLIIKLGFDIIEGPVIDISKHGIWALNHSEDSIYPVNVAGFWEMALKQSAVCVTLEQLTANAETGLLIDKAYFNRHWSFVTTNTRILEASISILFKNINKLLSGDYTSNTVVNNHKLDYKYPNLLNVVKYSLGFYIRVISILLSNINYRLFGIRIECWTLFIGEGDFSHSMLSKLNPVTLPKKEFWADPFIFNYGNS